MIFAWILLLLGNIFVQVTLGQRMSIIPKEREKIVKIGEEVTLLCQSTVPLTLCQFDMPSGRSLTLSQQQANGLVSYYGEGLDRGHCGLRIASVTEQENGRYICTVNPVGSLDNLKANMTVVVARAPKPPVVQMTGPSSGGSEYKEGETITATCRIEEGRPAANITWYIGEEKISDGLNENIDIKTQDGITTVIQNFTRRLQASDNGKMLKCVANHPLLQSTKSSTAVRDLRVLFGPKPLPDFEHFGLVEGEAGRVSVIVPANPKPSFTWYVNDEQFHEGDDNPSKRYYVEPAVESREKGSGYWDSVMVIKSLVKEDVDRSYRVKATNKFGEQSYRVVISTNPEPKVLDLGIGSIFAIVVGILLVLVLTAILVFARAKGRWCFSGATREGDSSEPEKAPPTSATTDTGGKDNPAVLHHGSSDYINSPDMKKPKEDTPV